MPRPYSRLRAPPALLAPNARSAASQPLAEEGVEHEWSIVVVVSDIALVGEQAL